MTGRAAPRPYDPASGRRRTGRPPVLSRERIAAAALENIANPTIGRVAASAGVSPSSLYHHVSGREELILLAAHQAYAAAEWPVPLGDDWRGYVEAIADTHMRVLVTHPGLALAIQELDQAPQAAIDASRVSIDHLAGLGFTTEDAEIALAVSAHLAADSALFAEAIREDRARPVSDVMDAASLTPQRDLQRKLGLVLDGLAMRRGNRPT